MGTLNNIIIFSLWWLSLTVIAGKDIKYIQIGNLKIESVKKKY